MATRTDQYGNDVTATTWWTIEQAAGHAGVTPAELRRQIAAGHVTRDAAGRVSDVQLGDVRHRRATLGRLRDVKATIRARKAAERRNRDLIDQATASDRRKLLLARLAALNTRRR